MEVLFADDETENEREGDHNFNGESLSMQSRKPFTHLQLEALEEGEEQPTKHFRESLKPKSKKKTCHRRRRRSSARFLRLTQPGDDDEEDEGDDEEQIPETEQLGELYQRAIRMNAENRINAGNSWNIKLIENMDKLTSDGPNVNFTKASCTLDASVKIYSYRVDDVHLTSYKVLANLNRNDAMENKTSSQASKRSKESLVSSLENEPETDGNNMDDEQRTETEHKRTETLETNISNINVNRLDAAYDIDPLFHKMSKTFDEGGAKGLLLVNLGVGQRGCNIVFDSKEEDEEIGTTLDFTNEGMIDISNLISKLDSALGNDRIESLDLVPQLQTLRQEYAILEDEGYITHMEKRSRRYATSKQEEKEAEQSIHQDFLERSRASAGTNRLSSGETVERSAVTLDIGDDQEYGEDDYGGDDNDDYGFDQFILNDGDRFSSLSFHSETQFTDTQGCKATTELLNSLCSEMTQNDYQFFSQETLSKLGNSWAGAAHWKKVAKLNKGDKRNNGSESNEGSIQEKKKTAKKIKFIDFNSDVSGFSSFIEKHKVTSKRGADATLLSKAVTKKYEKEDHILPLDAGMGIDQLSKLFLRPNAVIRATQKSVAFQDHVHTWDDGSFGEDNDNDDGPGYELRDEEEDGEFFVAKLDDVRKVEKIQVGYATVAKKVDVKRLKGDLWEELQRKIPEVADEEIETIDNDGTDPISFQKTIQEMEQQGQTQTDVTLPFYFICLLHLANEKGLALNSQGLNDIFIVQDSVTLC